MIKNSSSIFAPLFTSVTPNSNAPTDKSSSNPSSCNKDNRQKKTRLLGLKLQEERQAQLADLPDMTCSFIAVTDLLRGSRRPSRCAIDGEMMPAITSHFSYPQGNHSPTTISAVMREVSTYSGNFDIQLGTPEDPYLILFALRRVLLACGSPFALLPRLSPSCGSTDCSPVQTDIDVERRFDGSYTIRNTFCARCGHGGVPTEQFLP